MLLWMPPKIFQCRGNTSRDNTYTSAINDTWMTLSVSWTKYFLHMTRLPEDHRYFPKYDSQFVNQSSFLNSKTLIEGQLFCYWTLTCIAHSMQFPTSNKLWNQSSHLFFPHHIIIELCWWTQTTLTEKW